MKILFENNNHKKQSNSKSLWPIIILMATIFVAEAIIMAVIYQLPPMQRWADVFLDSLILLTILLPVIYFVVFRSIKESEEKFYTIADSARDAIIMVDEDSRINFWNDAAENIFGYTKKEALGKLVHDLIVSEKFRQDGKRGFEKFKKSGQGPLIGKVVEMPALRKNGEEFTAEHSISAVKIKNKWHAIAIVEDVSERKKSEDRLKVLDDLKNKFIKIVSHQLRTPLNGARWNLEILLGGQLGEMKKEQLELLKMIYKSNKEVIRRIQDLIFAIDIKEGRLFLIKKKTSLASLLGSATTEFQQKCLVKELACELYVPESELPAIDADSERMRGVIERLIENALAYTPQNGRITIAIKKVENNIRFEIMDTGIGIPKYEQGNIFTPFYRASNAFLALPDASGLGLFISKTIIESHGGKIGFESEENKGSIFWFEVPALASEK